MAYSPDVMIDNSIKSPRYVQVYSVLKDWILRGKYQPGQKIETESELCEVFGVSRITTRKAIDYLVNEKLLRRVQGTGTYVCDNIPTMPSTGDIKRQIQKSRNLAKRTKLENITIEEVVPDETARTNLKLSPGSKAIRVSYIRHSEGKPIGYAESYIPSDLGIQIAKADLKKSTLLALLEDKGIEIFSADQLIGATLADTKLASMLDVTVGAPLVRIKLLVLDTNQRPVEKLTAYYRADSYEHHALLARKPELDTIQGDS